MLRAIVIWAASLITFVVVATIGPLTGWILGLKADGAAIAFSVIAAVIVAPLTAEFIARHSEPKS